ncbi:MAG: AAA family ATPase [Candidatus Rokubacteria bacterium]|nr:AAA family ATPase [Candidatus Rokubacteria bacterium]
MPNRKAALPFKVNPFMPDSPVSPELFVGREREIEQIKKALYQAINERAEHLVLVGDRGIGKSSLATYAEDLALNADKVFEKPQTRFLTVFVSTGVCRNLDELCVAILDRLYRKVREASDPLSRAVSDLLSKVGGISVGFFGLRMDITPGSHVGIVAGKFGSVLEALWDKVRESYAALLIIIDETETLSRLDGAGSFLKSCLEQLSHDRYGGIMFIVTASPGALAEFTKDHASFPRGFTHVNIPYLNRKESDELVKKALSRGVPPAKPTEDFLLYIFHYSNGIPSFIHELGRAAFDVDTEGKLEWEDLRQGILGTPAVKGALDSLEDKHFRQRYTQKILSNEYRKILHIIAGFDEDVVAVGDILKKYDGNQNKLRTYVSIMAKRGVVEKVEGQVGKYRLPDRMFKVFLRLRGKPKKAE